MPLPTAPRFLQRTGVLAAARRPPAWALTAGVLLASWPLPPANATEPDTAAALATVEVIATTPLPGLGTPLRDVASNVQVFSDRDIASQHPLGWIDFLEQNPTGVTLNANQGNPFQPDVNFRGFTASPVLGTPQGLSVFVDGVRVNEPFGDVVNWDLIPPSAIAGIQLIPGSNPTFGLNTLGGALGVYTKNGRDHPGASVEVYAGSFGRKGAGFEYGGQQGGLDYFITANALDDHGWAQHNASNVKQLFGKLGWQDAQVRIDLSLSLANNTLQGTQTIPQSFYDSDIRQAYTWPDTNHNELAFLTLKGEHYWGDNVIVGGNAYLRQYRNTNTSSNVNNAFDATDPNSPQATNDRSAINQFSYGLGLQATLLGQLAGHDNQFTVGVSGDFGRAGFTQDEQYANFTSDRNTIGSGDFARITDASTRNAYYGLYVTDTVTLSPQWSLTGSGRYNWARVQIQDESGTAPALNGDHTFSRFNPAIGVNFNPTDQLTAYATYNQGSRAPTPIELACADPNAPCKLPNNFVSDPALKMVVSKTLEAGLRGKLAHDTQWSAALYRTDLIDDIQFISAGGAATNAGYFQNVGNTRRQGIELGLSTRSAGWSASVHYSHTDATFETPFTVNAPSNSSADAAGNIAVRAGNRIPGIPQNSLKLRLQYDFGGQASLGMNIVYSGSVYARGDENNQDIHGKVPGYTVVNLDGRYQVAKGTEVFARLNNAFNRTYANTGVLGQNAFTGPGFTFDGSNPVNEQFRGAGAPRGLWIGLQHRWL